MDTREELTFPERIGVLGVNVSRVNYDQAVRVILSAARKRTSVGVTALAVHGVMEGYFSPAFSGQLNSLQMVTPDGQPVRWALNILGAKELKERVYGPTLMLKVCEGAALEKIPVFLYGSREVVVNRLAENLKKMYPDLVIAHAQADRFRDATPEEDAADIRTINGSGAGIVFVGRGCPRQEKWIARHLGKVNAVMIGVGAAFDFHAGMLRQAPKFMQDHGLEWLYRLLEEPRRLWRRYIILNPLFMALFTMQLIRVKLGKKNGRGAWER